MEATSEQKGGHGLIGPRANWAVGDIGTRGHPAPGLQGLSIREARQPGPGSGLPN